MIVLALDTTVRDGSLALLSGQQLIAERSGDPALTHGQRLPGDLMRLLGDAGVALSGLDLLAVAAGPGSFTGIRVGIAAMQGLAIATGLPIVPVSTLEALAVAGGDDGRLIVPWVDAQRGQVFGVVYDRAGRQAVVEPMVHTPAGTLAVVARATAGERLRFLGDGAVRYAAAITAALGDRAEVEPLVPRLAPWIARIAAGAPERAVAPHAVAPIYLRRPDAEIARERRGQPG